MGSSSAGIGPGRTAGAGRASEASAIGDPAAATEASSAGDAGGAGRGPAPAGDRRRAGPLKRLYRWVLGWADRPGGTWALGGIAVAESFFFPIPPDVLLIPLCLGKPRRAALFATVCTAGSVVGGMVGYAIGAWLFEAVAVPILEVYGYMDQYQALGRAYADNLVVALGTAGFTPIPYKVFTIAAGGFAVPFGAFVIISAVSRGARFFLVAGLIRLFGDRIRGFIERYFNLLTIALAVAIVGGFLALRLFFH